MNLGNVVDQKYPNCGTVDKFWNFSNILIRKPLKAVNHQENSLI
jgi:hypothetical protein